MLVAFDPLASNVPQLPSPPAPPATAFANETDPADYIPQGMTSQDRVKMRQAAQMVTGALTFPGIGRMRPDIARASTHMSHFTTGGGADLRLSPAEVEDLALSSAEASSYETSQIDTFLMQVNDDFQGRDVLHQQYISRNNNQSSENMGTPWIGLPSAVGSSGTNWFYAIGAFWMCYTLLASRMSGQITITYRRHVFDRYNWHNDLNVDLPPVLGAAIPTDIMDTMSSTVSAGADDLPIMYMDGEGNQNRLYVDDSLFGSLIEDGEAHPYNVTGSGEIRRVSFPLKGSE